MGRELDDLLKGMVEEIARLKGRVAELERLEQAPTRIYARVYNNANINISTGTWTTLTYNSERWDPQGMHSTVSNTGRLTAVRAGWYVITGSVEFAANTTGYRGILIRKDGGAVIGYELYPATQSGTTRLSVTTQYYLAAGEYVEYRVYQNSGGDLDVTSSVYYSPEFMMTRIA